jgi:hypothetical protein
MVAVAAEPIASTLSEPLTWAEICERYPDQQVCLVEIDRLYPRSFEFRTARVAGHGKTRREAFEQVGPWWGHHAESGRYFTGQSNAPLRRPALVLDDETRDALRHRR